MQVSHATITNAGKKSQFFSGILASLQSAHSNHCPPVSSSIHMHLKTGELLTGFSLILENFTKSVERYLNFRY
jgi:hypothetical protein